MSIYSVIDNVPGLWLGALLGFSVNRLNFMKQA